MSNEAKCRSCKEPVLWVTMVKNDGSLGKRNCLDVVPTKTGNIERKRGAVDRTKWYGRVVPEAERTTPLYTSHFVDCPQAGKWRQG